MTRTMAWIGFLATLAIALTLGLYTLLEPGRQQAAQERLRAEAIAQATDLYAENCAVCHGAAGEGIGGMPALNSDGVRGMDYESLYRVIAFGRYNTPMAAWSAEEGGILTGAQIDQLIVLLQYGDWEQVSARVTERGLAPPVAVEVEVPDDLLVQIEALPGGESLSRGLTLYAQNCSACHGVDGSGTPLAPPLDNPDLQARGADEIRRTIEEGVPGTLMAGWAETLSPAEVSDLVDLILRWDELQTAGIALPTPEPVVMPSTPEMIAAGEQLFSVACATCHGVEAYGTRMAPSLNNQGFLGETPDAAIYQIIAQGVPGTAMPAWGGRLSDEEINSLVAYLRSLEATAPPAAEPSTEGGMRGGGMGPPWLRGN